MTAMSDRARPKWQITYNESLLNWFFAKYSVIRRIVFALLDNAVNSLDWAQNKEELISNEL